MGYCFVCLFRADKGASGLAFRIPLLWKKLAEQGKDVYLVINTSLFNKTLLGSLDKQLLGKVYIIPERIDFKTGSLITVPPLLLYLIMVKKIYRFHLSVGGAYFIDYLRLLSKTLKTDLKIHTSIGSKSLDMVVEGNIKSKYYRLHKNLMAKSDKIDCLYSPEGFPEFKHKCIQSPGSFSWKYSTEFIRLIDLPSHKNGDIVFCSTLIPAKNYRLALSAYMKLSEYLYRIGSTNIPNFILIAPYIPESISDEIISFNNKGYGRIILEKYENITSVLKLSSFFLSLQDYDNYPSQSLIEAMIFGCTIIATNTGETGRIVKPEYGNYIIEKNEDSLIEVILHAWEKPHYINRDNINLILTNHSIESYSEYFHNEFIL